MDDTRYILENVESPQENFPESFSIPSLQERKTLKPGQTVKLIFILKSRLENQPRAERMWVMIKEANSKGYSGVLDNDPRYLSDVKAGDTIEFGFEHIAAIYRTPNT